MWVWVQTPYATTVATWRPTLLPVNIGARVEVRNRFDAHWSRGFEVAEILNQTENNAEADTHARGARNFRLRRRSDGTVLPTLFQEADLREERRRQTWWQ